MNSELDKKWSTATLCIYSELLAIDEISQALDIKPTRSIKKGEKTNKRSVSSDFSKESRWLLDSNLSDLASLEEHINQLLEVLEKNRSFLEKNIKSDEIEIRCTFSSETGQGGFVLDRSLLKRLSEFNIDLIVSLYPPDE